MNLSINRFKNNSQVNIINLSRIQCAVIILDNFVQENEITIEEEEEDLDNLCNSCILSQDHQMYIKICKWERKTIYTRTKTD